MTLNSQIRTLVGYHDHRNLSRTDVASVLGSCDIYKVSDWFYDLMMDTRPRNGSRDEFYRSHDNIKKLVGDFAEDILKQDRDSVMDWVEYTEEEANIINPLLGSGMYLLVNPKYLPDPISSSQEKLSISYAD